MKSITLREASAEFERVFQLVVAGETVVVQRNSDQVALRRVTDSTDADLAPPGYFADDYTATEIAELNALASQAPQIPLP